MKPLTLLPLIALALVTAAIGPCPSWPLGDAGKRDGGTDPNGPTGDGGPASPDSGPKMCTPDSCAGKPVIAIGCASGEPINECVLGANGECGWRVTCPADAGGVSTCSGENPAQICRAPGRCIPSGCSCDRNIGTWGCTADCGGGRDCADGGQPSERLCAMSDCDPMRRPPSPICHDLADGFLGTTVCATSSDGRCEWISKCPDVTNCTAQECGLPPPGPPPGPRCPGGRTAYCVRDAGTDKCGWRFACTCDPNRCQPGPTASCPNGGAPHFCGRASDDSNPCALIQRSCVQPGQQPSTAQP